MYITLISGILTTVRWWLDQLFRAALSLSASPAFITRPLATHRIRLQKCHRCAKSDLISLLVNNFFLPQSKMLRQISLMRLTLPPSRKGILNKTSQKNVSLRSISTRAQYAAYFKTLDLPISATKEQVRRRYIELAKQHHPDAGESLTVGLI